MDKQEKLEMLRKLSEKELTKKFLIPLYESSGMGCKNVRYTHRRLEFGKDIIYFKEDEYGNKIYTGIQVKKTQITTKNIDNILRQTMEAFGEPFTDLSDGKKKDLDRFAVLTSNEFLEEANQSFRASLKGAKLDKLVTCIDGNQLVCLLDKHMPSAFWDEYDYFDKYFKAMRKDFETIRDISAIGQREPVRLENIYVSLKLTEEIKEQEIPPEQEWKIFREKLSDNDREEMERWEERAKVIDAERAVQDYERLVIVGAPGSGKTTLLKYLTLKACRENLEKQERICIPIPIVLRQMEESALDLRTYIDKVFENYEFPKAKKLIEKDLKAGSCMVFLDGFDELATKENQKRIAEAIEGFVKKYPKASIVVTSRVAGYHDELKRFTKVELMDFDDKQIEKFVDNWFGQRDSNRANSMFNAIKQNEQIKSIARNPLMVAIIAIIYEEDRDLPQRRADLYKRCVEVLLSKWDVQKRLKNKYPSEKKEFILRKLAFYGHTNNKRIMTEDEIVEEMLRHFPQIGLKEKEAKDFLDEIWKRSYLLRQVSMESYDFLHLSFQEYFTALELKERSDGLPLIVQNIDKPWWEEPILLYAGISRDASNLIKAIEKKIHEDIFYSNLILLGKCVADAEFTNVSIKNQISYKLWDIYKNSEFWRLKKEAIETLWLIKPKNIIESLIKDLKSGKKSSIRVNASVALGIIGSYESIEPLTQSLSSDRAPSVRQRAASALGSIGSEKAIEYLIEAMVNDENSEVRGRAASALGRIADEKAIKSLIEAMVKDDDSNVKGRAAAALTRMDSNMVIEPLTEVLSKCQSSYARGMAASVLGRIRNVKAVDSLLDAMERDVHPDVRGIAATALGQIGSEKVVVSLIKALEINDIAETQARVASALGNIASEKSIMPLTKILLRHTDGYVRCRAASALGHIVNKKSLEPLIKALAKDNENYVRESAAQAIGWIGNDKAIEPLIKAIVNDRSDVVQISAASSLGNISSEKSIEFLIEILLSDKDSHVRGRAASEIGNIGSERVIEQLLKALKNDKDNSVRAGITYALGKIGSEKSIAPLIEVLLSDENSNVRARAAFALGNIGNEMVIEPLKQALKDEGEYNEGRVKDAAFDSLKKIARKMSLRITRD